MNKMPPRNHVGADVPIDPAERSSASFLLSLGKVPQKILGRVSLWKFSLTIRATTLSQDCFVRFIIAPVATLRPFQGFIEHPKINPEKF
jgi:hypothetical protein